MKRRTSSFRNLLVTFHNPVQNGFNNPVDYLEYIKSSECFEQLRFLTFQWEKTPEGLESSDHYQMYFELENKITIKNFQKFFFNSLSVHVDFRRGSQEHAISYCTDKTKELVLSETFSLGIPRRNYDIINRNNSNIPNSFKERIIHISEEIKNGNYNSLKDIEIDYPVERWTHENLFQRMINNLKNRDEKPSPARVIWIFGESGDGKTVWTQKLLRTLDYKYYETKEISYPDMNNEEHIWFERDDQFKRVLIVNEVDQKFPKKNNLISWIDRVGLLDVKNHPKIDNNFELIIINSIYRPEEVFNFLTKKNAKQVLRRIFNSHTDSSVYKLASNLKQLELASSANFVMSDREFEEWYQPIVIRIKEIDWRFFTKE